MSRLDAECRMSRPLSPWAVAPLFLFWFLGISILSYTPFGRGEMPITRSLRDTVASSRRTLEFGEEVDIGMVVLPGLLYKCANGLFPLPHVTVHKMAAGRRNVHHQGHHICLRAISILFRHIAQGSVPIWQSADGLCLAKRVAQEDCLQQQNFFILLGFHGSGAPRRARNVRVQ